MKDLGIGSRVNHPKYGEGVVCGIRLNTHKISFIGKGIVEIAKAFDGMEILEEVEPENEQVSVSDVKSILTGILEEWSDTSQIIELGDRWNKGKMILKPGSDDLAAKEIPIETFFHKIVMVRDRLRVLEQKINSCEMLSDEEKVDMQQYITRIYGSLTTFNVLFKSKDHHFIGMKGE
jgi:hypothetical protein